MQKEGVERALPREQEGRGRDAGLPVWGEGASQFLSAASLSVQHEARPRAAGEKTSGEWRPARRRPMAGRRGKGQSGLEGSV